MSGGPAGFHRQSVDRKDALKRKQGLNLFERFRLSKQDKIAANVQQHIRAIRAAEALDRQTGRPRRKNSSKMVPQKSTSSGDDDSVGSEARKMRLVALLRQAYGNDIERVPGFIEFAESAKVESRRSYVDSSAQTSYDLLETWFPALRKRIAQSEKELNNTEDEDMPSVVKPNQKFIHSKLNQTNSQKQFGLSSRSSVRSPQASINEETVEDMDLKAIKEREKQLFSTSSPTTSDTKNETNLMEMKTIKDNIESKDTSVDHNRDISMCRHRVSYEHSNTGPKIQSSSPKAVNKAMSSEESLLSGAGSLVIEESASSGGDSSPGSGVYKNIIINLSGLALAEYNDLSQDLGSHSSDKASLEAKVNNIESTGQQSTGTRVKKHSK